MKTLDSGIVLNDGRVINCKYYEIEDKLKELIGNYIIESPEHNEEFQKFSKFYSTFRPYFDFAISHLGVKILNPLMEKGSVVFGKDWSHWIINPKGETKYFFCMCDDMTLDISKLGLNDVIYDDCIISGNLEHIMRFHSPGHYEVIMLILNLLLISNKEIAEAYLKESRIEEGFFLSRYYPFIRYQFDSDGYLKVARCFYRDNNKTKEMEQYMDILVSNRIAFPHSLVTIDHYDKIDNPVDLSDTLRYKESTREKGNRR